VSNAVVHVKGFNDLFNHAGEAWQHVERWQHVEAIARAVLPTYRYEEIRTPILERTDLFARGIGEATDIVGKEMFTFTDRGGRDVTLRPENTAGVVRAVIEHKLYTHPTPQKYWYMGPMFRNENVQAGRYRQFHQLGVECLGSDDPRWDAEVILLAQDFLNRLGLRQLEVQLGGLHEVPPGLPRQAPGLPARAPGGPLHRLRRAHRAQPAARARLQAGGLRAGPRGRPAALRGAL
jgi:histidyl-tRNA synthetase